MSSEKYDYITVYNINTKEVLACVSLIDGKDGFARDDVQLRLYRSGTGPTFKEEDGIVKLSENTMIFRDLL